MSKQPFEQSATPDDQLETRLRNVARNFAYPPTPDVAGPVRERIAGSRYPIQSRRWLVWAAITIVICLAFLLAVPQVRAAIVNWLHLGGVIIVPEAPTATATTGVLTPNAPRSETPAESPQPSATALQSIFDLAGKTTLTDAQQRVSFPIRLPTYPPGLHAPDRVYLQDLNGSVVVLIWLDAAQPDGIRVALHILGPGAFVYKMQPNIIAQTTVNGRPALWTEGPYFLEWRNGSQTTWDMRRIVIGNVLIWTDGPLTYRLESGLSLDEALKIAQSVPPVTP